MFLSLRPQTVRRQMSTTPSRFPLAQPLRSSRLVTSLMIPTTTTAHSSSISSPSRRSASAPRIRQKSSASRQTKTTRTVRRPTPSSPSPATRSRPKSSRLPASAPRRRASAAYPTVSKSTRPKTASSTARSLLPQRAFMNSANSLKTWRPALSAAQRRRRLRSTRALTTKSSCLRLRAANPL